MIRRKRVDISSVHGGGMEDVNEQELARATDSEQFFGEPDVDKDRAEEPSLSVSVSEETETGEEINLPVTVPEPSEVVEIPAPEESPREEEKDDEEDVRKSDEDGGEQEPPDDGQDKYVSQSPQRRGRIYIAVIAICLVLSLILASMAFMDGDEPVPAETEETASDTEQEQTQTQMSTEQLGVDRIYEEQRSASVTVSAISAEGKRCFSGTAVMGDGHIVTVYSGIANADRIEVTLSDGKTYGAALVGGDQTVDLALLKTDASELKYIQTWGDVTFEAGKRVYAIGTVEDAQFGGSLFEGVVAYGERTLEVTSSSGEIRRATAVQIGGFGDPALCGSPVFDEYGTAVALVWNGGDDTSVGLALPLDRVMAVVEFFKNGEEPTAEVLKTIAYSTPSLGIVGQNGSVGEIYGVVVTDFSEPVCDAAVKLREGDVIVKIGDTVTADTASVREAIYAFAPGDKVEVHVIRNEQRLSFFVELI